MTFRNYRLRSKAQVRKPWWASRLAFELIILATSIRQHISSILHSLCFLICSTVGRLQALLPGHPTLYELGYSALTFYVTIIFLDFIIEWTLSTFGLCQSIFELLTLTRKCHGTFIERLIWAVFALSVAADWFSRRFSLRRPLSSSGGPIVVVLVIYCRLPHSVLSTLSLVTRSTSFQFSSAMVPTVVVSSSRSLVSSSCTCVCISVLNYLQEQIRIG